MTTTPQAEGKASQLLHELSEARASANRAQSALAKENGDNWGLYYVNGVQDRIGAAIPLATRLEAENRALKLAMQELLEAVDVRLSAQTSVGQAAAADSLKRAKLQAQSALSQTTIAEDQR